MLMAILGEFFRTGYCKLLMFLYAFLIKITRKRDGVFPTLFSLLLFPVARYKARIVPHSLNLDAPYGKRIVFITPLGVMVTPEYRFIERFVNVFFVAHKRENVCDVGSYIGQYTIKASLMMGNTGRVVSVEPDFTNFALILQNLQKYRCKNVIPINMAVYDRNGFFGFNLAKDGRSHSFYRRAVKYERSIVVPCITLDSLLERCGIGDVGLIKIDVEGAELKVISGAEKLLARGRKRLIVEIHPWIGDERERIIRLLRHLGYKLTFSTLMPRRTMRLGIPHWIYGHRT